MVKTDTWKLLLFHFSFVQELSLTWYYTVVGKKDKELTESFGKAAEQCWPAQHASRKRQISFLCEEN